MMCKQVGDHDIEIFRQLILQSIELLLVLAVVMYFACEVAIVLLSAFVVAGTSSFNYAQAATEKPAASAELKNAKGEKIGMAQFYQEKFPQAANALRPLAGDFAFLLFALGILGVGLIGVPVLAGSAAYAMAEAMGWKTGLERTANDARGF